MRNDPDNYKWGIFYSNAKDPRIILPKRNLWMGFTVNVANPYSYLIILLILILSYLVENI
ncbi:MAG: DUF5808 domain-containing protein [Mangrovibacterium sp.]